MRKISVEKEEIIHQSCRVGMEEITHQDGSQPTKMAPNLGHAALAYFGASHSKSGIIELAVASSVP